MSSLLRLYEGLACLLPLSLDGTMTNPDEGVWNGALGASAVKTLYLSNMRTSLVEGISFSDTSILVDDPVYEIGDVISIDTNEIMLITDKFMDGEDYGYEVIRGILGSSQVAHIAAAPIVAAYDYTNVVVQGYDEDSTGGDESSWLKLSLTYYDSSSTNWDSTAYDSLVLSSFTYNQIVTLYRNIRVPAGQEAILKRDLRWKISASRFIHQP